MSTRDISSVLSNALDDDEIFPFFAVELQFDVSPLRMWTGLVNATIDGNLYNAAGNLLNISTIEETSEIAARGASITLSGIPSETLSAALQTPYQGRKCIIYFGVVSGLTYSSLTEVFSGFMDEMNIVEDADTCTIELKVENKLIDLERQRVRRYSSGYHKTRFPGDKGFDFVESLQGKETLWGKGAND